MNIFVLSLSPKTAASYHCDKHVVKMVLETSQMLCSARHRYGVDAPYKPAYINHPCTRWAGDAAENYQWLLTLGKWLSREYTLRYGKVHKCNAVLDECRDTPPGMPRTQNGWVTPFAQAMPDHYKNEDPVAAYRAYYLGEKARFAKWKTKTPEWWEVGGTDD